MDNREPTPEVIGAALKRAQKYVTEGEKNLIEALALCTMSAQCDGYAGFRVFRDVRAAVASVLPAKVSLANFSDTADTKKVVEALESAYLVVMS